MLKLVLWYASYVAQVLVNRKFHYKFISRWALKAELIQLLPCLFSRYHLYQPEGFKPAGQSELDLTLFTLQHARVPTST